MDRGASGGLAPSPTPQHCHPLSQPEPLPGQVQGVPSRQQWGCFSVPGISGTAKETAQGRAGEGPEAGKSRVQHLSITCKDRRQPLWGFKSQKSGFRCPVAGNSSRGKGGSGDPVRCLRLCRLPQTSKELSQAWGPARRGGQQAAAARTPLFSITLQAASLNQPISPGDLRGQQTVNPQEPRANTDLAAPIDFNRKTQ